MSTEQRPHVTSRSGADQTDLEMALLRAAQAEERATRLGLELAAAQRRIADLEDFDYGGNADPLIEKLALFKARVGRTRLGAGVAPVYRRLTGR